MDFATRVEQVASGKPLPCHSWGRPIPDVSPGTIFHVLRGGNFHSPASGSIGLWGAFGGHFLSAASQTAHPVVRTSKEAPYRQRISVGSRPSSTGRKYPERRSKTRLFRIRGFRKGDARFVEWDIVVGAALGTRYVTRCRKTYKFRSFCRESYGLSQPRTQARL